MDGWTDRNVIASCGKNCSVLGLYSHFSNKKLHVTGWLSLQPL